MSKLTTMILKTVISGATEAGMLDLMLQYSRGGSLNFVDISHCSGLNETRAMKRSLTDAYKSSSAWIRMSLNDKEIVCMNLKLSPYYNML